MRLRHSNPADSYRRALTEKEGKRRRRHGAKLSSDDIWDGVSHPKISILRKEVIQPQVPLRLPCYDFGPVADPTVVSCPLAVSALPSGRTNSHAVTGGVYKARERIHRSLLFCDY